MTNKVPGTEEGEFNRGVHGEGLEGSGGGRIVVQGNATGPHRSLSSDIQFILVVRVDREEEGIRVTGGIARRWDGLEDLPDVPVLGQGVR